MRRGSLCLVGIEGLSRVGEKNLRHKGVEVKPITSTCWCARC